MIKTSRLTLRHFGFVSTVTLASWAIGFMSLYLAFRVTEPAQKKLVLELLPTWVPFLLFGAACLTLLMHLIASHIFNQYIKPLHQLVEETHWIYQTSPNPDQKIKIEGAEAVQLLAATINDYSAEHHELIRTGFENQTDLAAEESCLLKALFEFAKAAVVTSEDGRIILYNQLAKDQFPELGLGRKVDLEALKFTTHRDLACPDGRQWAWWLGGQIEGTKEQSPGGDLFFSPILSKLQGGPQDWGTRDLRDLLYTAFDFESTGLNPSGGDEIIELGAVRSTGRKVLFTECFQTLVKPSKKPSQSSSQIHGIMWESLIDQPKTPHIWPEFCQFLDGSVLLTHNGSFDQALIENGQDISLDFSRPWLDTLILGAYIFGDQAELSLEALGQRFGLDDLNRHRALGDAKLTALVFVKLLEPLRKKGIVSLNQAVEVCKNHPFCQLTY
ncbi:MAG: 3'-5' exonuclease [SAR324 cluster bacterium]|nr:3'-5' exonuclease [SAR324 cluster bacterium]